MSFFLVVVVALIVPFKVMLHWPTCNADSHNACFSHEFADMLHLWIAFKNLQRVKHCKYRQKIVRNGVLTLERFFAQHRIIASWRCTLTSVTPPLNVVHQYIYFSFSCFHVQSHTVHKHFPNGERRYRTYVPRLSNKFHGRKTIGPFIRGKISRGLHNPRLT